MNNDSIGSWVGKAKANAVAASGAESDGVKVVRRDVTLSKGQMIMDVADRIWPGMLELFKDVRDKSGMLLQPAHIRGIALNVAQKLVEKHYSPKS